MAEIKNKPTQETPSGRQKRNMKTKIRKLQIVILAVILGICCIHVVHQLTNSVSATVMIDTIFSSDGQNPDRTPFSIMEVFNDEIMNNASKKLDKKLSASELRSHLTVSDTMDEDSFSRLEQSIFDGENENTYFPTEYRLTYSTISEQIQSEGIWAQCKSLWNSLFLPSKTEILNAVLQSYREYYAEKYLNYDALFEIDWSTVDSMDYYNRFEFMNDTVWRLLRFLQDKRASAISSGASNMDIGYDDLIVEFTQGPVKNIGNYQAYILQYGVTINKVELLRQFAYMQRLYEEEHTRKTQEHQVLMEAIEMYDATTTKVVFIPALDGNEEFYMNRTKVGLDYLTEKSDSAKLQADSAAHLTKEYAYFQTCFGEEYIIDENGQRTQIRNTPAQQAHTDELYERLKADIQRLITDLITLRENRNEIEREGLRIGEPYVNVGIVSLAMYTAKRLVLLSMAAYVVVYAMTAVRDAKQKKMQGAEK